MASLKHGAWRRSISNLTMSLAPEQPWQFLDYRDKSKSMPVITEISESIDSHYARVRSVMTLPDGKWAGAPLRMFFSACNNATCECTELMISLVAGSGQNPNLGDAALRFTVDVGEKKLVSKGENGEQAREVTRHFDSDDWQVLWRTFLDLKREHTENLNLDHTAAEFQNHRAIEDEGELVAYSEILPHGRKFFVESSDGTILLDEQYCLRRGCDCDRVAACFIPIKDGKQSGESAMAEVHYRTGKVKPAEQGSFTQAPTELFRVFLEMYPDILKQFSKRHKQLNLLYGSYMRRHNPAPAKLSQKIGRNEPCPCGSGKKFKKCCALNGIVELGL